jgi:hypothetical protein
VSESDTASLSGEKQSLSESLNRWVIVTVCVFFTLAYVLLLLIHQIRIEKMHTFIHCTFCHILMNFYVDS